MANTGNASSSQPPSTPAGGEGGEGVWRRHDPFMNMYGAMRDQMDKFNAEVNQIFSDHFNDSFFAPRSFFSPPAYPMLTPFHPAQQSALNDRQQTLSTDLAPQRMVGGGGQGVSSILPSSPFSSFFNYPRKFFNRGLWGGDDGSNMALANWKSGWGGGGNFGQCVPRLDVTDEDNHYLVHADLPGMKKEDIKVNVQDGRMKITGARKEDKKEEGKDYMIQERCSTEFFRSFPLPQNVKENEIKANFDEKGTLKVTIPKDETDNKKNKRSINIE